MKYLEHLVTIKVIAPEHVTRQQTIDAVKYCLEAGAVDAAVYCGDDREFDEETEDSVFGATDLERLIDNMEFSIEDEV